MTLRGPADPDHYRTKVGRFRERWYVDPLPACEIAGATDEAWPSISSVKPPFANPYVAMRRCAEMPDEEWHRLALLDPEDRYDQIKSHDRRAGRVAMDRGTIVHAWAEDLIAGRPPGRSMFAKPDAQAEADTFLGALQSFFDDHQPEPVAVEVVCIHRTLNGVGYGGTGDLICRIDGGIYKVDWKTRGSDHDAYTEEAAQVGGYALAEYMIAADDDGVARRMRIPDLDGGLVVSIRPDGYKVFPIDLERAGRLFADMHQWWHAQREHDSIGKPWAPAQPSLVLPSQPAAVEGSEPSGEPTPDPGEHGANQGGLGHPLADTVGQLRRRLERLVADTECEMSDVKESWPSDCGRLSTDLSADQLDRIAGVVGLLEMGYGLSPADAPTAESLIDRLRELPADLLGLATVHAKALDPPIPNLRSGKATEADLERLERVLMPIENLAAERLAHLVNHLSPMDEDVADSLIEWATEQREAPLTTADAPALATLDNLEAERLVALAEFYAGPPDDVLAHLVDVCGSKSDALTKAKEAAERHGLERPKSTADVAENRVLAALTTTTQAEGSTAP